jgi:uncharacterized protein (DUF58 family)
VNRSLDYGYQFGFGAWLVGIFITIAVIVWIGWLILLGLAIVFAVFVVGLLRDRRLRRRERRREPAVRGRRYRVVWRDSDGEHNVPGTFVRTAEDGSLIFARTVSEGGGTFRAPADAHGIPIIERD